MRLLIAGIGLIGARHLKHAMAMQGIEVVGVVDPALVQNDVPQFRAIDEVDVPVDAIVIATPSHLHADHAEAAAARGWHMLIEKPVAHSVEAARRIVSAAKQAGVQTLVGHHRRHHAHVARLKRLSEDGKIGQPITANLIWALRKPNAYFDVAWRSGADGSPVMINLVHEVDTLRHLFGDIDQIKGIGSSAIRNAGRVESGAVALSFQSGLVATIAFSDAASSPWAFESGTGENPNIATTGQDMLWITGTKGSVSFPSMTLWDGSSDWSQTPEKHALEVAKNTPLVSQLEHFCDVVAGRAVPLISASDGLKTLRATLANEAAVTAKSDAA